jgi:nucleoside 2-deoxyribosyltransferase
MTLAVIEALDAYLEKLDNGTDGEVGYALNLLRKARQEMTFADDKELARARDKYALGSNDDVEIDDGALTSQADEGTWVQAWVWLRDEQDTCRECGEPNDNGDGFDGLCGNCADRAENEGD